MTDKPITVDHILTSIKLRLVELDLDIYNAKNVLPRYTGTSGRYQLGILHGMEAEKETLEKIMSGEYEK